MTKPPREEYSKEFDEPDRKRGKAKHAQLLRGVAKAKMTTLVKQTKRPREDDKKDDEPDRKRGKAKRDDKRRGTGADAAQSTCNACGRSGHAWSACKARFSGHPDRNKNASVKFADSEEGRAWKSHATYPMDRVPVNFTLDGKKLEPKGK